MFCKIVVSKFSTLFKIECAAANCSKIKLVIYQFAFSSFFSGAMAFGFFVCCRFYESTKTMFKS